MRLFLGYRCRREEEVGNWCAIARIPRIASISISPTAATATVNSDRQTGRSRHSLQAEVAQIQTSELVIKQVHFLYLYLPRFCESPIERKRVVVRHKFKMMVTFVGKRNSKIRSLADQEAGGRRTDGRLKCFPRASALSNLARREEGRKETC